MKKLDFLIVGAQKCATTTLHKYLQEHPQVDLPLDKEAPFFNGLDYQERDYEEFLRINYLNTGAQTQHVWGKASPQYMSSPLIPARIKSANPDIKIIAVLRNPVKRAFSHYRMAVRRGMESRTFETAMTDALDMETLTRGRQDFAPTHAKGYESEADFYLAWGEYGRILEHYLHEFGRDNLMVIFTEDLQSSPDQTLDKLLEFIGLDKDWRPESLGKRFHEGGGQPWINPGVFRQIAHAPGVRRLYAMVSETQKKKLRYWIDQLNVRKNQNGSQLSQPSQSRQSSEDSLSPELMQRLHEIYSEDARRLSGLGFVPPWAHQL